MKTEKKKVLRVSTIPLSLNLLLKGQLKMLNEEYEVVAVSSPGEDLKMVEEREGVRIVELPMERRISLFKDIRSLWAMIKLIRKEKPWMVYSLTPKAGLVTMIAGKLCGVPVRVHMFTGLVFPTATGLKRQILMFTDRLTCFCATVVNPEGEGVKRDLERYHISSKPLTIIGNGNINGLDMEFYDRTPEVLERAKAYQKEGTTTYCFVGRIVGDKGINELVSAFKRFHAEHPATRLLLVGPFEDNLDPVSEETRNTIETLSAIEAVGWQSDVRPFLAASDVFVFPSYREGFPNVVMQAGALGLPSIVTDINGSNEIIRNGENGVIIPSKDEEALYQTLKDTLENPDKWKTIAANARESIARRYEQQMLWKEIKKFYKQQEG
ncbi:MAG: glycosyltransferase family 4 protein [Bacteroidaceae bacterium]|nr:glycosyltransferase family 4 protein [Bacteroidaceae bacterium]